MTEKCIACEEPLSAEDIYYYGPMKICDDCAEIAANMFWSWHSGEYLTWEKEHEKQAR